MGEEVEEVKGVGCENSGNVVVSIVGDLGKLRPELRGTYF